MLLHELFDRGARLWPERACLVDAAGARSYREVELASHQIANALRAIFAAPEFRAAVLSPNCGIAFEAVLGILRAGGTWLPANARAVAAETQAVLAKHGCEVLFFHSEFSALAVELARSLPALRHLVCLDCATQDWPALRDWCAGQPPRAPAPAIGRDSVAVIKPTGGTTGAPKSVMQTHGNFAAMTANFLASMPFAEPPVHLVAAPMTHGAGSICFPLLAVGATHVILPKADPGEVLRAIEAHRVNVLFLPPTVIYALLAHPDLERHDYSSLRYFIYAAAPMSVDKLREALRVFGPVMAQTYGQAEAPMLCTFLGPAEHRPDDPAAAARLASCGRATPFTAVEIMADDGSLLEPGATGEIVVRGDLVFKGYYEDPAATAAVSTHGWHHTGDIGWRDPQGYVYLVDRKRDLIISGGFNVFPSEVEQVLWSHPAVQDCAVIGVPDERWGEAVKAVVELKPDHATTPGELLAWCRERLGGVKAPKSVEIWELLPRSAIGKVLKKDIRARYWQGRERQI